MPIPANIKKSPRLLKDATEGTVLGWGLRVITPESGTVTPGLVVMELDSIPSRKTELKQFRREPRWKTLQKHLVKENSTDTESDAFGVFIKTGSAGVFAVGDLGGLDLKAIKTTLVSAAKDQCNVNLGKPKVLKWSAAKGLLAPGKDVTQLSKETLQDAFADGDLDDGFTEEDARALLGELQKILPRVNRGLDDMSESRERMAKLSDTLPQEQIGDKAIDDVDVFGLTDDPKVNGVLKQVLGGPTSGLGGKEVDAYLKARTGSEATLVALGMVAPTAKSYLYDAWVAKVLANVPRKPASDFDAAAFVKEQLELAYDSAIEAGGRDPRRVRIMHDLLERWRVDVTAAAEDELDAFRPKAAEWIQKLETVRINYEKVSAEAAVQSRVELHASNLTFAELGDQSTWTDPVKTPMTLERFESSMTRAFTSFYQANETKLVKSISTYLGNVLDHYADSYALAKGIEEVVSDFEGVEGARSFDQSLWGEANKRPYLETLNLRGVCFGLTNWFARQDPTKAPGSKGEGAPPLMEIDDVKDVKAILHTMAAQLVGGDRDSTTEEDQELDRIDEELAKLLKPLREQEQAPDPQVVESLLDRFHVKKAIRRAHKKARARFATDKEALEAERKLCETHQRQIQMAHMGIQRSKGKFSELTLQQLQAKSDELSEHIEHLDRMLDEQHRWLKRGMGLVSSKSTDILELSKDLDLTRALEELVRGAWNHIIPGQMTSLDIGLYGKKLDAGHAVILKLHPITNAQCDDDVLGAVTFFDPNCGVFPFASLEAFLAWAPRWFAKVYRGKYDQVNTRYLTTAGEPLIDVDAQEPVLEDESEDELEENEDQDQLEENGDPSESQPEPGPYYHFAGTDRTDRISAREVAARVARARDQYHQVWKDGWSDWQPHTTVEEIMALLPPDPDFEPASEPEIDPNEYEYEDNGDPSQQVGLPPLSDEVEESGQGGLPPLNEDEPDENGQGGLPPLNEDELDENEQGGLPQPMDEAPQGGLPLPISDDEDEDENDQDENSDEVEVVAPVAPEPIVVAVPRGLLVKRLKRVFAGKVPATVSGVGDEKHRGRLNAFLLNQANCKALDQMWALRDRDLRGFIVALKDLGLYDATAG